MKTAHAGDHSENSKYKMKYRIATIALQTSHPPCSITSSSSNKPKIQVKSLLKIYTKSAQWSEFRWFLIVLELQGDRHYHEEYHDFTNTQLHDGLYSIWINSHKLNPIVSGKSMLFGFVTLHQAHHRRHHHVNWLP